MSDQFIAEIRLFAGNFAPAGWAYCNGQLLPIAQNTALFSLLGTTYGGDGRTTFALPDLRGRGPVHPGNGPGLTPRSLGQKGGAATVSLLETEMPQHTHPLRAHAADPAELSAPGPDRRLARSSGGRAYATGTPTETLASAAVGSTGGSQPHDNLQPYLAVTFIIALQGVYPSRS